MWIFFINRQYFENVVKLNFDDKHGKKIDHLPNTCIYWNEQKLNNLFATLMIE